MDPSSERRRAALSEAATALVSAARLPAPESGYHALMGAVHRFLEAAHATEAAGASIEEMRELAAEARRLCGDASTILAYTQRWPRGYPGDFALIERLVDGRPDGEGRARLFDQIVLNLPIVEQHRAKVAWQADCVRRALARGGEVRVLSVACGGVRDLALLAPADLARLRIVLNDVDADGLALARSRLRPWARTLDTVEGNVLRALTRLRARGPFDVIVVGGLLDYLPARPAGLLVRRLLRMLAPAGELAATNIAAGNPWRLFLELLTDWTLIHRDEAAMRALLAPARHPCDLTYDRTGLTWLGLTRAPPETA